LIKKEIIYKKITSAFKPTQPKGKTMKKLSILAAMFGVLFATASIAHADGHKKNFKDMTPEQKAEFKKKKEARIKKCMETGKSEAECKKVKMNKKGKKGEKSWENMTEEQRSAMKQKKEAKYKKCLETKSQEECKKLKKGMWKKDGDCPGKEKGEEVAAEEVKPEAPAKKKRFFGLF